MGGKSNIVRENDGFEKTIIRQVDLGVKNFFVLMDADVFFYPYETFGQEELGMKARIDALKIKFPTINIGLFWASKSFESWLIGGLKRRDDYCGLRKINRAVPGDTQAFPESPKVWVQEHMIDGRYNSEIQECLTRHIDIGEARKRNNSLRFFLSSF